MRYQDKRAELAHNESIAHRAEAFWGWTGPVGWARAKRRAEVLLEKSEIRPGDRVLEVGCGTGVFTYLVCEVVTRMVALDISEAFIKKAKEKMKRCKKANKVSFVAADLEKVPFLDGSFDAVIGSSVLHHVSLDLVLPELKRLVKRGGKLVFIEPNLLNPQIFAQKKVSILKRWLRESPNETAFVRWSMARRLGEKGYKEIEISPIDFLHPFTPARMIFIVKRLSLILEKLPVIREIAGSLVISCRV